MKFAHIAPFYTMQEAHEASGINMTLAHLVAQYPQYVDFYKQSPLETIMDNGAFELGQSYDPEKLISLGKSINANILVAPDYPGKSSRVTRRAFESFQQALFDSGEMENFKVMYVPQSMVGDVDDYIEEVIWALNNPDIDLVGISILGAPNAFKQEHDYAVTRTLARFMTLKAVKRHLKPGKVHMLGMLDSVAEIALCTPFKEAIYSWDTSAAMWAAMNNKTLSELDAKFSLEVDFESCETGLFTMDIFKRNVKYIQKLIDVGTC